jgi:hypothetical protein
MNIKIRGNEYVTEEGNTWSNKKLNDFGVAR